MLAGSGDLFCFNFSAKNGPSYRMKNETKSTNSENSLLTLRDLLSGTLQCLCSVP